MYNMEQLDINFTTPALIQTTTEIQRFISRNNR